MIVVKFTSNYGFCMTQEQFMEELGSCKTMQEAVEIVKNDIKKLHEESIKSRQAKKSQDYKIKECIFEIDDLEVETDEEIVEKIESISTEDINRRMLFSLKFQNNDQYSSISKICYGVVNKNEV